MTVPGPSRGVCAFDRHSAPTSRALGTRTGVWRVACARDVRQHFLPHVFPIVSRALYQLGGSVPVTPLDATPCRKQRERRRPASRRLSAALTGRLCDRQTGARGRVPQGRRSGFGRRWGPDRSPDESWGVGVGLARTCFPAAGPREVRSGGAQSYPLGPGKGGINYGSICTF